VGREKPAARTTAQTVTHPDTNHAQLWLTSVIHWKLVQRMHCDFCYRRAAPPASTKFTTWWKDDLTSNCLQRLLSSQVSHSRSDYLTVSGLGLSVRIHNRDHRPWTIDPILDPGLLTLFWTLDDRPPPRPSPRTRLSFTEPWILPIF
jgi:hypothetical protein